MEGIEKFVNEVGEKVKTMSKEGMYARVCIYMFVYLTFVN